MGNTAAARLNMVESQIRTNKVTDNRIVAAMAAVPRENFVPKALAGVAYIDEDIQISSSRFLLEPMVLARLLQAAEIKADDVVLDVACGTGYSTAVLARLAAVVVALEDDAGLAEKATDKLADLGADNAAVLGGKLPEGVPDQGPYDVVLINGSIEHLPDTILKQVADGGRVVAVVNENGMGRATLFHVNGGSVSRQTLFEASVPQVPGFGKERGFVF